MKEVKERHLLALKLLGISSSNLASIANTSVATISRNLKAQISICGNGEFSQESKAITKRMNSVKRVELLPLKGIKQVKKTINETLNTNSQKHSALLWFGNISAKSKLYAQPIEQRLYAPRPYSRDLSFLKLVRDNKINQRKSNLKLVLQLLDWHEIDINNFIGDLYFEQPLDETNISPSEQLYRLLKVTPRYPSTTKQKSKRKLTSFIIKHLERDPNNFVYMEKFDINEKPEKIIDGKVHAYDSWWVYGHKDILDWFECE